MSTNDASTAIESFQSIPKCIGTPTYTDISDRHHILKQNASSVTTTLAGGNHGLLALIIPNAEYVLLTNEVWIEPPNPGQQPQIPAGTNRVAQENILSQWKNDFKNWKLVKDVCDALKKQILDAFDNEFLEDLKDPNVGYAAITPLQMIEHLYQEYGTMTAQDILDNRQRLRDDFDTSTSIVTYFYNIREIRNTAAKAGQPITDGDLLTEIYLVMDRTGIFDKAIDKWDALPTANKTWPRFQTHFRTHFKRWREKQKRQAQQTAGQANLATEEIAVQLETHLAQFVASAQIDRDAMANLTTANATLVATNAELTTKLSQCQVDITKLQKEVEKLKKKKTGNRRGNGNSNSNGNTSGNGGTTNTENNRTGNSAWKYYCWSHGLTNDSAHCSMNCPNPKQGHCRHATFERKFGGSEEGC